MRELARHYRQADITQSLLWFDHDELPRGGSQSVWSGCQRDEGLSELTGSCLGPRRVAFDHAQKIGMSVDCYDIGHG